MRTNCTGTIHWILFALLLGLGSACVPAIERPPPATASESDAGAEQLAQLYLDDASWPTRVWLEERLSSDSGEVLVKPHRSGVLMYLRANGEVRVDFGRHGAHTVPIKQTNLASESARVRAGEASKTFPNLLGMLMNRVVRSDKNELEVKHLAADDIRGGRILLVFADPSSADVRHLNDFALRVEESGDVRLVTFVPITEELDGDVLSDLRSGGWSAPFVMTPMARSYVSAMLEPGVGRLYARLATDEGRILAEGPPGDETASAMIAELRRESR